MNLPVLAHGEIRLCSQTIIGFLHIQIIILNLDEARIHSTARWQRGIEGKPDPGDLDQKGNTVKFTEEHERDSNFDLDFSSDATKSQDLSIKSSQNNAEIERVVYK